ncbi:hypothetical protein [Croceicoccus naphthovorans]|uniref:Uncharacterized protein n=1 Tax=Croceicoccus naphthovorans TaxID=1348774 RepID=A0A0G3XBF8_9SPHN|nr:hypothetical protein [Croceicoccus naphthovorans]AKM08880.1 hypothetical protein AB433_01005 [Croceicoccus naphthovorans]MBB3989361.1 hypothetical protein [Croceicoccus naphthovorans]
MSENADNWYRRKIGRRIERGMNRLIAGVLAAAGFLAAYFSLPPGNADGEVRWFGLIFALILFGLARQCLVARGSVIEGFGDEADPPRRK